MAALLINFVDSNEKKNDLTRKIKKNFKENFVQFINFKRLINFVLDTWLYIFL